MKTLLIDNYDSFTYNLADYLATVEGVAPTVIRNDEPGWHLSDLDAYDNVVISPGPGTPGEPADFGICREVIAEAKIPLLGVCLGHQGIATVHGGSIALSATPRHGRVSTVHHDGSELFAGIPSPLEVVRYHSWAVDRLPDEIEGIAWTADGVLMGLRHRHRPQWGVQFHPESIATQNGKMLLANFSRLSRACHRSQGRSVRSRPGPPPVPRQSPPSTRRFRLLTESCETFTDAESAFEALFLEHEHAFWLDSSRVDERLGRFSIMGTADGPLGQVASGDVRAGTVTIRTADGPRLEERRFLDWLDEQLRGVEVEGTGDLPFDFHGGWVGYLGYELKAELEGIGYHDSEHPDAVLLFASRFVVFDHHTDKTYVAALYIGDESVASSWIDATLSRLQASSGTSFRPRTTTSEAPTLVLRHDREAYVELIESCQRAIALGESYEVCLTNMIEADHELDIWPAYTALRRANPAPFAALLRLGSLSVLSTSPERFLRVGDDGRIEARPIKGTRARGRSPEEDARLRVELAECEKDRSENLMIVDLMRNDLARVSAPGSIAVPELFAVESYTTVHQLVSTVTARLEPGNTAVDCVKATFPGGSMTGAPKRRTMTIIDELEGGPRGVYSGAIGYFSLSGASDLSIAIRTLVADGRRISYGVGGAIVALSDADDEIEETVVKAAPLLRLFGTELPTGAPTAVSP